MIIIKQFTVNTCVTHQYHGWWYAFKIENGIRKYYKKGNKFSNVASDSYFKTLSDLTDLLDKYHHKYEIDDNNILSNVVFDRVNEGFNDDQ